MKRYLAKWQMTLAFFALAFNPVKAFAEKVQDGFSQTSYAMTYHQAKDRLDQFTSKVWFGNDWLGLSSEMLYLINTFVQAIFWVTKAIFTVCSGIYYYLSDVSVFDTYITIALNKSASLFQGLKTQFLPLIGLAMVVYLLYVFFVQNGSFVKTLLRLFLTFLCASMFFTRYEDKYVIKHIYDGMTLVTEEVATNTLSKVSFGGQETASPKSFSGQAQSAVLDKYFDIAIWQPYRYLNGDVTSTDGGSVSFFFTDQEYIELLDYTSGDDGFKLGGEEIKKIVGTEKEPLNTMMKSNWGKKFTYAFSSVVDSVLLGVILDVFAVTAFAMRLMVILLIILGAFVAVIAMFPTMENTLYNLIKRMGMSIAVSGLIHFIAIIILWFYDFLSTILDSLLVGQPFLTALAKIAILWYLYVKRDLILSILTADRVTHFSNGLTNRLSSWGSQWSGRLQDNALSKLRLAGMAGRQTMSGAGKIATRRLGNSFKSALSSFKPKTDDSGKTLKAVERQDGEHDLERYQKEGRQRRNLESVKDIGRQVSSFKNKAQARLKQVRAEGVKDKTSDQYRTLRQEAEEHLNRSRSQKNKALGYRQREHNQATKERLLKERTERHRRLNTERTKAEAEVKVSQRPNLKPKLPSSVQREQSSQEVQPHASVTLGRFKPSSISQKPVARQTIQAIKEKKLDRQVVLKRGLETKQAHLEPDLSNYKPLIGKVKLNQAVKVRRRK